MLLALPQACWQHLRQGGDSSRSHSREEPEPVRQGRPVAGLSLPVCLSFPGCPAPSLCLPVARSGVATKGAFSWSIRAWQPWPRAWVPPSLAAAWAPPPATDPVPFPSRAGSLIYCYKQGERGLQMGALKSPVSSGQAGVRGSVGAGPWPWEFRMFSVASTVFRRADLASSPQSERSVVTKWSEQNGVTISLGGAVHPSCPAWLRPHYCHLWGRPLRMSKGRGPRVTQQGLVLDPGPCTLPWPMAASASGSWPVSGRHG